MERERWGESEMGGEREREKGGRKMGRLDGERDDDRGKRKVVRGRESGDGQRKREREISNQTTWWA